MPDKLIDDLRADVAALTLRNETLVASLGDLNAVALRLRADVTRLDAELERLRDDATEVLTDNADLKSEQTEVHAEIVRLEGERDALRDVLQIQVDAEAMSIEELEAKWGADMVTDYMNDRGASLARAALEVPT